jgi:hypothetical protein
MSDPEYGETWVYEGIVGALPGLSLSTRTALLVQFVAFEGAILLLAWWYGLWTAAVAGTVAVLVATAGSAELVRIAGQIRRSEAPKPYRRLLFGSNIEVVLAIFAFIALITYIFVVDQGAEQPLLESLFGQDPPVPVVYLTLLILWDVCYRIGAGWWTSVAGLWRSVRYQFDPATAGQFRQLDLETAAFGLLQLAFVPFLLDQPVLLGAVVGHVIAVTAVTGLSVTLLAVRQSEADR